MILLLQNGERQLLHDLVQFFQRRAIEAFVVGGTVRDWLLQRSTQDLDLAVAGDAFSLTQDLAREWGAAFVPLDPERGTARVVLRSPNALYLDLTQLQGDSLQEDLARRDFTINAMAIPLEAAAAGLLQVIDPFGGQTDLQARRIRALSQAVLQDDPLRLLRAVRLAAVLDFTIEPETRAWIAQLSDLVIRPSSERIRDELVRLLACGRTADYLRLMDELGLLGPLFPELSAGKGVQQPPPHQWDVFEHALKAVERFDDLLYLLQLISPPTGWQPAAAYAPLAQELAPFLPRLQQHLQRHVVGGRPRFVLLKLLTLLHDVGKPETRSVDAAGRIHFYQHEQVGARMVADILRRLHFGALEVKIGRTVVYHHMRPKWLAASPKVSRRAIYRFFRATGEAGVDVVLLSLADRLATQDVDQRRDVWHQHLAVTRRLLQAWFEQREAVITPPALVNGKEVMQALNLEAGPIIGQVLEAIREAQATGKVTTREEALAFAQNWLTTQNGKDRSVRKGGRADNQ